jgi:hypothetical protein
MADKLPSFKIGEAPWEQNPKAVVPQKFQVGQAPWEKQTTAPSATTPEAPKITPVESAARGFGQGASLGFADEISGAVEALWNKAKGDPTTFGKLYQQFRDESRANFDVAQKANPSSYTAGEVGGSIAAAAAPLGATATLGRAVVTGARIGGINALGQSRADNLADAVEDVAKGTVLGAAGGVLGKGIEKGVTAAKRATGKVADDAANRASDSAAKILSKESGSMPIENAGVFKEAAVSAKNRVQSYWNPKVDPKFKDFAEIAKRNGIDPNELPAAIRFGPESSASRAERSLAEGRFGEETLTRFNQTLDKVRGAYDRKIQTYSGGAPVDAVTAGKVLRDSYDEGVSKFFDSMDFTHNTIIDQVPGMRLTDEAVAHINKTLSGAAKTAQRELNSGITKTEKEQARQILNAVAAVKNANGDYAQTVDALRRIGKISYLSKNSMADVPVDVANMRKIYNATNEGMIESVRAQLGDDIADQLVMNNQQMSEFFGDKSLLSRILGDRSIAPENAFKSLLLNGDSQKVQALKKVIPPERWEYLKGAVLENLAKRDPEGAFTFKQLHSAIRGKENALASIFSPEELADHAGLVRLGDRFGNPVLSTSGTGASLSFKDVYEIPANLSVDALALRNANKAAAKKLGDRASQARDVSPRVRDIPARVSGAVVGTSAVETGQNAQENNKGPTKWANDGFEKLLQHAGASERALIEQSRTDLLKDPKTKNLLIRASDLTPGSKAMDQVLERLRKRTSKERE